MKSRGAAEIGKQAIGAEPSPLPRREPIHSAPARSIEARGVAEIDTQ
jgi:hypothetical protein